MKSWNFLTVALIFVLYIERGNSEDLYARIDPDQVYLDTLGVSVSCVFNSQKAIDLQYITVNRIGWFGKRRIVTITDGNPPEIGYFFAEGNFTTRLSISGNITEKYVKISFQSVTCLDEGHYECKAGGIDNKGFFRYFTDSNSMVIRSHTERPIITINGVEFSYNVPITITEDIDVVVECDAHVGKPPKTMYWYIYDNTTSSFVLETTMIGKAERRLPVQELCKWYTTFDLRFTAKLSTPETRLKCVVGSYEREVIIRVRPKIGP